jgi:lactosylceramide 4-alpha-galactosyltransferase
MVKDVCGRENCTEDCPDPVRLPIDTGTENAFFLETSGSGMLNIRQACAVESLAYHNPNLNVNVLFVGGHINGSSNTTQKLAETYTNLRLIGVDLDEYLAGTALEKWYHCTNWRKGPYHVSHLSDGLRFLTLNKFGGYYFDLDVLMVKPVTYYRNFVSSPSGYSIASNSIHADLGNPVMEMAVKNFVSSYR